MNCIYLNQTKYGQCKICLVEWKANNKSILGLFPDYLHFAEFETTTVDMEYKDIFWGTHVPRAEGVRIFRNYIQPYIDASVERFQFHENRDIDFENDLIIHVRSGDIFEDGFDCNHYKQPPYSFYKRIIESRYFPHIYILTEDVEKKRQNPVISKLLESFRNITLLCKNSLKTDFKIMLQSKYFVNSNSTLCLIVNSLSCGKKMIYLSHWSYGYHDSPVTRIQVNYGVFFKDRFERDDFLLNG